MESQDKVLRNFILSLINHNQLSGYGYELEQLLEPGEEENLHLVANMFLNEARQYWHIVVREAENNQPQHPNQKIVEDWIKEHRALPPKGE